MAVQITSSSSSPATANVPLPPAPKPPTATAAAAPVSPADTVNLSATAQAHLLQSQGQSTQQISSSLGLTTAATAGYLGTQLPKVVVKVEQAPTPVAVVSAAPEEAPTTPVPASQLPST